MFEHLFAMSDAGVQVFVRQDQDATTKVQRGHALPLRGPRPVLVAGGEPRAVQPLARAALPQALADHTAMSLPMRILVTSTPGMGHLNALLPLMFALQEAGHDLLVVTATESCEHVAGLRVQQSALVACPATPSCARLRIGIPEVQALPPRRRRGLLFCGAFRGGRPRQ